MNECIITFDGHTNPALLALEILQRLRHGRTDTTVNQDSFRYVATLIPDFQDTGPVDDIDTMESLHAFAFAYGFLIKRSGSSIEAMTRDM